LEVVARSVMTLVLDFCSLLLGCLKKEICFLFRGFAARCALP
jgi:hypothetical protein